MGETTTPPASTGPDPGPPALSARGATRRYTDESGLFEANLSLVAGQVHALAGMNGSGKTTLLRAALGMVTLNSGQIDLFGTPVAAAGPAVWQRVGYLVDTPLTYRDLTVRASLHLAARLRGIRGAPAHALVRDAVADLDLADYLDVRTTRLSLGNLQRVGIAAAIQHRPDLVLLDEPTNALDPAGVLLLRRMIRTATARGAAVLISSHHLDELTRLADRITVLHRGYVIGSIAPGTPDAEHELFELALADDRARDRTGRRAS